jgi:S1-C subfamily serine protease
MKRTALFLALALVATGAGAADAPKAQAAATPSTAAAASTAAAPKAQAAATASAAAAPTAASQAQPAAEANAAARAQLNELRGQLRELTGKMAELSTQLGDDNPRAYAWRYIGDKDRAIIGILTQDDPKGIKVVGVTPSGPAEKAGMRHGDVIVSVDGRKVDGKSRDTLNDAFGNLKVDQSVKLAVLRDGKNVDVNLKAVRREAWNWPRALHVAADPDIDVDIDIDEARIEADVERAMAQGKPDRAQIERIRREARETARHAMEESRDAVRQSQRQAREAIRLSQADVLRIQRDAQRSADHAVRSLRFRMPWWGLNLVSLNDDLSGYFGTKEGVLVLSADDEAAPSLKSGDVLQSIGGDKVDSPEDAMRLLRDAPAGTDVKLSVVRRGKTLALSMKAPEFKSLFPLPPEPPEPPAAPAPPAPPAAPIAAPPPPPPPVAAPVAAAPVPPTPPKPPAAPLGRDD